MATTTATPFYPEGSVLTLLESANTTMPTRMALQERLTRLPVTTPRFFDDIEFFSLQAVCRRLISPSGETVQVDIAGSIDTALTEGNSDGWRHDAMPPDALAYRLGMQGLDQTAAKFFNACFTQLDGSQQDSVLCAIQQGDAPGLVWQTISGALFFEELLARVVEIFYAHPLVQESIGYAGMADAPGWQLIGLNQLEAREPKPLSSRSSKQHG